MKIIFFGSDDFALTNLQALIHANADVAAVVTQPDRKKGRGMKMAPPVIKECAQRHNIPVLQPEDIKSGQFVADLIGYKADVFVVIAYGRILPKAVLDIPTKMAVNIHGSLLPKYRGAAPINWAIMNGETSTGVSVIAMNERMDAGDIIAAKKIDIDPSETGGELRERMAKLSAELLLEILPKIDHDEYQPERQDMSQVTYASKITKELCLISWNEPAQKIYNLVRALAPKPGAFTFWQGKQLKVLAAQLMADGKSGQPGEIVDIQKDGLIVATGKGHLLIKEVHLESAKATSAKSFAAGQRLKVGDSLG